MFKLNCLPEKELNVGRINDTNNTDNKHATIENRNDSPKNCEISCERLAPITFRKPISFARFTDRAVERLIKLQQAINKIKSAVAEKT